jgi:lysophospholipase
LELFATPENPIPQGTLVMRVLTDDGRALRVARWDPTGRRARGTVCLMQGRAEFIEKYFETVGELRQRGFAVVAFDWRGQGGSERALQNPRKGHVDDFALYFRDIEAVMTEVIAKDCPQPVFALAHSMGAAITFHALNARIARFERLVALAPMVRIAFVKAPRLSWLVMEALDGLGFGASFIPCGGATSIATKPFPGNRLSTDPVRYGRNATIATLAPHLAIGDPTVGWIDAAFRCMAAFEDPRFATAITTPTLVIGAGADPVISTPFVERFAARLKAGRAIVIPGARHEILMEQDHIRDAFWAAFDAFVPGSAFAPPSAVEALQG